MNSSSDEFVKELVDRLEERGISCWYADRDAPRIFEDSIPKAIRNCKIFLLILDKKSTQSAHVKNELKLFFRRVSHKENVALFPIRVESYNIPDGIDYFIAQYEITDYNRTDSESIQNLVDEISKKLKSLNPNSGCSSVIVAILIIIAIISAVQSSSIEEFIDIFAQILIAIVVIPLYLVFKLLQWLSSS